MVSLQNMTRKNGTAYVQVLYRLNGKQTSTSFDDAASAEKFRDLVGRVKGLASVAADPALSTMTVEQWVAHYIEHRTALAKSTLADYHSYAKRDINPTLGPIPLKALSRDDCRHTCASWLIAAGVSMATVYQHLGHASIQTTVGLHVYLDRTGMQAVAGTMDQLVGDGLQVLAAIDYRFGFGARRIGHDPGHF